MGEKTHNPLVYGGTYDTAGYKRGPKLPELKFGEPETVNGRTSRGVDVDALRDYAKANKDLLAEHRRIKDENKQKQKRAKALKRGEVVNFRVDKCKGDPVI
jgi:hypothetical protein